MAETDALLEILPLPLSKFLMQKAFRIGGEGRNRTELPNQILKKLAKSPEKSRETCLNSPEFFITLPVLSLKVSLTALIRLHPDIAPKDNRRFRLARVTFESESNKKIALG